MVEEIDRDSQNGVILKTVLNKEEKQDLDRIDSILEKRQDTPSRYWCFTLNNYAVSDIQLLESYLKPETQWYIFQEEEGKENGTRHLQGTIYLNKPQRLTALKKLNSKIHWEKTRSVKASIEYCSKYESRCGNIYAHGIDIPKQIQVDEPYGWQLEVMEILKQEPDKRTIHWFYEETGGKGKSTLCKYLLVRHNALVVSGKANDMFYAIATNESRRKVIIIDSPRESENFINYQAIEQIKNGFFLCGKYESKQIIYNHPHIIVFANHLPRLDAMSRDRWKIYDISRLIRNLSLN